MKSISLYDYFFLFLQYDFELDGPGTAAYLSVSTKCITFVDRNNQEVIQTIPCKSVLGWRPTPHTYVELYHDCIVLLVH